MPRVEVDLSIAVPPEEAWAAVVDVLKYPDCMESVDSVEIVDQPDDTHRTTAWAVRLKGSVLQWTETELIDHAARRFDFEQVSGDLGEFVGHWAVRPGPGSGSTVSLHVDFDIGIPLLAEMLNPVAADALRESAAQMLAALEQRLLEQQSPEQRPLQQRSPEQDLLDQAAVR
ncbi:ribosome-associated toxin RatA of RatAB toxin-antitoxin module [Kitasatospora sp. MAP12-15]|uniref:type II toxin-antitoxin system RatA family toxin n=1 Tax=unclassified Kitasatospora TaxID=2633591 RepID=UPI002475C1AA|nr:SRPBCC family protein [Kitasatospora sp. MAP12-44]MDH6115199.1 ribosome-associated toxin RatA of RatAB toxin-antitoxin module [Kitasatospora sp. MAP12-44]